MAQTPFKDISYAQGIYNMASNSDPIIVMKMSGFYTGSKQPYYDAQASRNYVNAVKAGKAVGLYHFAGGADPIAEADFFVKACSPLAENDVLILDWEIQHDNPVGWVQAFVDHVHAVTGVWPWVYMNMSTANGYNWDNVFKTCGYWCAAPSFGFDAKLPVKYPQIAQQGPIVGGLDTDMFFGTVDQFKKYGYHAPVAQAVPPQPVVVPAPVILPPATTTTRTSSTTITVPANPIITVPNDVEKDTNAVVKENNGLLKQILALLQGLVTKITGIFK